MYAQSFLVISDRGRASLPTTWASCGLGFIGFMRAELFLAGFLSAMVMKSSAEGTLSVLERLLPSRLGLPSGSTRTESNRLTSTLPTPSRPLLGLPGRRI